MGTLPIPAIHSEQFGSRLDDLAAASDGLLIVLRRHLQTRQRHGSVRVCVCVCACVRACVLACVRVCVCVCISYLREKGLGEADVSGGVVIEDVVITQVAGRRRNGCVTIHYEM